MAHHGLPSSTACTPTSLFKTRTPYQRIPPPLPSCNTYPFPHLVQLVVPQVEHSERPQVGQRVGQTGKRVLVERQRLQPGETAELGRQRGEFVAIEVQLREVCQVANGGRQLSDLHRQRRPWLFRFAGVGIET